MSTVLELLEPVEVREEFTVSEPTEPSARTMDPEGFLDSQWKGFELVQGVPQELGMSASAAVVANRLSARLLDYAEAHDLGWVLSSDATYRIYPDDPDLIRRPDISLLYYTHFPDGRLPDGHLTVAPELVVEVVSPTDKAYTVEQKVREYRSASVRLIWIIYPPTETILVRRLDGTISEIGLHGTLEGENVVPGFSCPAQRIFRRPPKASTPPA